jgi:hypothetical protein
MTEKVVESYGDRIREISPEIDVVQMHYDGTLSSTEGGIEAFFCRRIHSRATTRAVGAATRGAGAAGGGSGVSLVSHVYGRIRQSVLSSAH